MKNRYNELLEKLQNQLTTMSNEDLKKEFEKLKEYNVGPTITEYMDMVKNTVFHYNVQLCIEMNDDIINVLSKYANINPSDSNLKEVLSKIFAPDYQKFVDINIKGTRVYIYSEFYNTDANYDKTLSIIFKEITPYTNNNDSLSIYKFVSEDKTSKPYKLISTSTLKVSDGQLKKI